MYVHVLLKYSLCLWWVTNFYPWDWMNKAKQTSPFALLEAEWSAEQASWNTQARFGLFTQECAAMATFTCAHGTIQFWSIMSLYIKVVLCMCSYNKHCIVIVTVVLTPIIFMYAQCTISYNSCWCVHCIHWTKIMLCVPKHDFSHMFGRG